MTVSGRGVRLVALGLLLVPLVLVGAAVAKTAAHGKNQTLPYGEVNWDRGYVRISAVGLPPFGAGSPQDEEVARANAVAAAQKRLLAVLLDLDTPQGGKLRERIAGRDDLKEQLRQLVFAAGVQGKSYSDGSVEVTLTLPLKGANGLQSFIDGL